MNLKIGTKLLRTPGVPASPRLGSIKDSVSPQQGRYYAQDAIARQSFPLKVLGVNQEPTTDPIKKLLDAILKGNRRGTPSLGKVPPISASELNNPQRVRKPSITKAR